MANGAEGSVFSFLLLVSNAAARLLPLGGHDFSRAAKSEDRSGLQPLKSPAFFYLGAQLTVSYFAWLILSLAGVLLPQVQDKVFTYAQPARAHAPFRTKRADFFFPLRSCALFASRMVLRDEAVGSRRETSAPSRVFGGMKSLFLFRRLLGEIALMLWLVIKGARPPALHLSFRTERADFFFPLRSCEAVGSRRETFAPSRVFGGMKSLVLFRRLFGEIALMLWLVIKGAKPPALHAAAPSSAAA